MSVDLIDDYYMTNGKPITDPASGYDSQNPYLNRDPRLYETFILDGDKYNGRTAALTEALASDPVNYPQGADWAQGGSTHVLSLGTGLACRKWGLDRNTEWKTVLYNGRSCA